MPIPSAAGRPAFPPALILAALQRRGQRLYPFPSGEKPGANSWRLAPAGRNPAGAPVWGALKAGPSRQRSRTDSAEEKEKRNKLSPKKEKMPAGSATASYDRGSSWHERRLRAQRDNRPRGTTPNCRRTQPQK